MNFLSHLYLAGNSEGAIIGNFIADSVKGSAFKNYPEEIQKGILLHRKIDTFTDAHPVVEQSKQRLRDNYKKYAGVIVDIYYDHYLAVNWADYSNIQLNVFAGNVYKLITQYKDLLPPKSSEFSRYMVHHNILTAYANLDGIEKVLKSMSQRTSFVSNMEHAINDLKQHYELFEKEFKLFFPELQQFVNTQIEI